MSGGEMLVVVLIALLLFGAKAIPDIARTLGKGMREFKKATSEIQREISESTPEIKKSFDNVASDIEKEAGNIRKQVDDNFAG